MFNVDDILAQMAAGKTIEQIAQDAADVLNAAKAQHDKMEAERLEKERAAAAAKAKAEREKKEKIAAVRNVIKAVYDYMDKFHPGFIPAKDKEILNKDEELMVFCECLDAMIQPEENILRPDNDVDNLIHKLSELAAGIDDGSQFEWHGTVEDPKDMKRVNAAIDKFLRNQGLK